VNMQDIAQVCDMERRTLYNYYNNKEQMALEIMKCWYASLESISDIQNQEFPNAFEKIKALVYRFYDFAIEDPDAIRYSVHFEHYFRSKYSDIHFTTFANEKILNILHDDLMMQGVDDGSVKPQYRERAHEISLAIQGAMLSYTQRILFREEQNNPELIKTLLDILLDAIKA